MTTPDDMTIGAGTPGDSATDESDAQGAATQGGQMRSAMRQRLSDTKHEVAQQTKRLAEDARTRIASGVRSVATTGAASLSKGCHDVGDALRDASETLRRREDNRAASFVSGAAAELDSAGRYLESHSPEELADDAGNVIRRHPVLVLGGLFAAGLLVGRFLRASSREESWEEPTRGPDMSGDETYGQAEPFEAATAAEHTGNPPYRPGGELSEP